MKKTIAFMLLIIFCFCTVTSVANASNDLPVPTVLYDKSLSSTSQFLVKILRPEGNETVIKKSYILSGIALQKDLVVQILRKNNEGNYEKIYTREGISNWEIGPSGLFMKEIQLNSGPNRLRIAVYKKGEEPVPGKNCQISDFTVTLLSEKIINEIFNLNIGNIL